MAEADFNEEDVADTVAVIDAERDIGGDLVTGAVDVGLPDTRSLDVVVGDPDRVRLSTPLRLEVGLEVGDAVRRRLLVEAAVAVVVLDEVREAVFVFVRGGLRE